MTSNRIYPIPGEWPCQTEPDEELPPRLVAMLYVLLRDHVHPGDMEQICLNLAAKYPGSSDEIDYTNPHLEGYARALATFSVGSK